MYARLLTSFLLIATLAFTGAQCRPSPTDRSDSELKKQSAKPAWIKLSENIERRELEPGLVIYKLNPKMIRTEIHYDESAPLFEEWQNKTDYAILINGGYFDEHFQPTGLLIKDGLEIGSNRYDDDRSGSLIITDHPYIIDTADTPIPEISPAVSVLQSFPLLISKGLPAIKEDSNKLARRTVVAADKSGDFLIIIADKTPVSLYALMNTLLESDLELEIALNLDGGPSTTLSAKTENFEETLIGLSPLPQVISFQESRPRLLD